MHHAKWCHPVSQPNLIPDNIISHKIVLQLYLHEICSKYILNDWTIAPLSYHEKFENGCAGNLETRKWARAMTKFKKEDVDWRWWARVLGMIRNLETWWRDPWLRKQDGVVRLGLSEVFSQFQLHSALPSCRWVENLKGIWRRPFMSESHQLC